MVSWASQDCVYTVSPFTALTAFWVLTPSSILTKPPYMKDALTALAGSLLVQQGQLQAQVVAHP